MSSIDLEALRSLFADKKTHIAIARVDKVAVASDKSFVRCQVAVMPEETPYIAKMSWDTICGGGGFFQLPSVNDLVLIAFADGDKDQCYIIRKLSSKEDTIPSRAAVDGDMVFYPSNSKRLWFISDNKIYLSASEAEPTEPLVLGNVLKTLLHDVLTSLSDLSDKLSKHKHFGNLGYPTSAPDIAPDILAFKDVFDGKKASPVDDGLVLSDIAFTEKGD